MRLFENLNIDFLSKRKLFYLISATIILLGIVSIVIKGLDLGIDFKGGSEVVVSFDKPVAIGDVRDATIRMGLGNVELKTFGATTENVLVRTELQDLDQVQFDKIKASIESLINKSIADTLYSVKEQTSSTVVYSFDTPENANLIADKLFLSGFQAGLVSKEQDNLEVIVRLGISDLIKEGLRTEFTGINFDIIKEDKVGPKIGEELKRDAIIAIVLALVVILVYVGFRFKFTFGLGAVFALFHDVLVTLGFVSFFNGLMPGLNLEITQSVIAAFLALVGFSVNDTVVIFDRIRENLKIHKTMDFLSLINFSINRTLSRTILTSGTVLIVIIGLLLFGGEVNKGFAFTLFIGVLTGTYSTIYIASAFVYDWTTKSKKKIQF
ncbi:MAG: protein translocase subunit SecF [Bacteroidetes bacterium]|nr:protein translocase subunit SecF [Bacteroidota bacterium]MBU2584437.1 protein translocase subunit SecF [Bacteroidota bacterium]